MARRDGLASVLLDRLGGVASGNEVHLDCLWCEDTKRHLYVNVVSGKWICWRCDKRGTGLALLKELRRRTGDGNLAFELEARREVPITPVVGLPAEAAPLWEGGPGSALPHEYMATRGVPTHEFSVRQLHFATTGRYAMRVLIPVLQEGEPVYWTARSYEPECDLRYMAPRAGETKLARNECVFGYDQAQAAAEEGAPLVVMEGAINAMIVGMNAVALQGKVWSRKQLALLLSVRAPELIVAVDADAMFTQVGRDQRCRAGTGVTLARALAVSGRRVSAVIWPSKPKRDASDLGRSEANTWIRGHKEPWTLGLEAKLLATRA